MNFWPRTIEKKNQLSGSCQSSVSDDGGSIAAFSIAALVFLNYFLKKHFKDVHLKREFFDIFLSVDDLDNRRLFVACGWQSFAVDRSDTPTTFSFFTGTAVNDSVSIKWLLLKLRWLSFQSRSRFFLFYPLTHIHALHRRWCISSFFYSCRSLSVVSSSCLMVVRKLANWREPRWAWNVDLVTLNAAWWWVGKWLSPPAPAFIYKIITRYVVWKGKFEQKVFNLIPFENQKKKNSKKGEKGGEKNISSLKNLLTLQLLRNYWWPAR